MKKLLVSGFLALASAFTSAAIVPTENGPKGLAKLASQIPLTTELVRYTNTPGGTALYIRDLGVAEQKVIVEVEFTIGDFQFINNNHLAFGVGDLFRALEQGYTVIGEGMVLGVWSACGLDKIIVATESFSSPSGRIVEPETCVGPLSKTARYRLVFQTDGDNRVEFALYSGDRLIATKLRAWIGGQAQVYKRGFFLVPVQNSPTGSYVLHSVKITKAEYQR